MKGGGGKEGEEEKDECNIPCATHYLLLFALLKIFKLSSQLLLCWKYEIPFKFQCFNTAYIQIREGYTARL
jgi:hypothetical protein